MLAGAVAMLLILGGVIQVGLFATTFGSLPRWQTRKIDVAKISAPSLPAEWNGWTQTNYEEIQRAVEDPFGNWSKAWTYTRDGRVAKFSLDYAWPDPHDLGVCYRAIGWSLSSPAVVEDPFAMPFVEHQLQKPLHPDSLLLFSLHNLDGQTAVEFDENRPLANKFAKRQHFGPWYQLQLLATGFESGSEQDQRELKAMFADFRQIIIRQVGK
jgi:hypothetical protein